MDKRVGTCLPFLENKNTDKSSLHQPEAPAVVVSPPRTQVFLYPTAKPALQAVWDPPLHIHDSDGPLESTEYHQHPTSLKEPIDVWPHLKLPDAGALHGGLLNSAVHKSNEHVEQQDVSEDDIADEEHIEHLLILVVFSELHVAHANGELEEL